jgi:hypothetical protein
MEHAMKALEGVGILGSCVRATGADLPGGQ